MTNNYNNTLFFYLPHGLKFRNKLVIQNLNIVIVVTLIHYCFIIMFFPHMRIILGPNCSA